MNLQLNNPPNAYGQRGTPRWLNWEHADITMPKWIHTDRSTYTKFKKWLTNTPYVQPKTSIIDPAIGELFILGVGLLIRDVSRAQFMVTDPDEEPEVVDLVLRESKITFDDIPNVLLPVCKKMSELLLAASALSLKRPVESGNSPKKLKHSRK